MKTIATLIALACTINTGAQLWLWHKGEIVAPYTKPAELHKQVIAAAELAHSAGEKAGWESVVGEEYNVAGAMGETTATREFVTGRITVTPDKKVHEIAIPPEVTRALQGLKHEHAKPAAPVSTDKLEEVSGETAQADDALECTRPNARFDSLCSVKSLKVMSITDQGNCRAHHESGCTAHDWAWTKTETQTSSEKTRVVDAAEETDNSEKDGQPTDERYQEIYGCKSIKLHTVVPGDYLSKYSENLPRFRRFYVPGASFHCTQKCNVWKPSEKDGSNLTVGTEFHICGPV